MKKTIYILLFLAVMIGIGCSPKKSAFVIVNKTSYTYDDITTYASFFNYDDNIREVKFVEYALLKEASANITPKQTDSDNLYFRSITNILYATMKKEASQLYENALPDDLFTKQFVVNYDYFIYSDEVIKRENDKTVFPGDLPAPIDHYLAQARPGDVFSDIETKFGFFTVTVVAISPSPSFDATKIQAVKNATSMALLLKKIKKDLNFKFYPDEIPNKGSKNTVITFKHNTFSVSDIEQKTILPVDPFERFQSIKYYGEMKLLEVYYKKEVSLLRDYCDTLAKIKIYQNTYFATNLPDAKLKLGATLDELTLSDGTTTEKTTVFPDMEALVTAKKGDTVRYLGKKMTVVARDPRPVSQIMLEEFMLRQLFKDLQAKYPIRRVNP